MIMIHRLIYFTVQSIYRWKFRLFFVRQCQCIFAAADTKQKTEQRKRLATMEMCSQRPNRIHFWPGMPRNDNLMEISWHKIRFQTNNTCARTSYTVSSPLRQKYRSIRAVNVRFMLSGLLDVGLVVSSMRCHRKKNTHKRNETSSNGLIILHRRHDGKWEKRRMKRENRYEKFVISIS